MSTEAHWEGIYQQKGAERVSWFRPHLDRSLEFIERARLPKGAGIIDVGGGASTLPDDLLARGYSNVTVLDLSAAAIEVAKARLGPASGKANWIVGDVCSVELPQQAFDFWHDRAVFHFLRDPEARGRCHCRLA